jgi:WD repeat-containing protein 35
LEFEKKDVWDVKWAADDPESLSFMEKSRLHTVRGVTGDEPMQTEGFIYDFRELEVHCVLLEDLMKVKEK